MTGNEECTEFCWELDKARRRAETAEKALCLLEEAHEKACRLGEEQQNKCTDLVETVATLSKELEEERIALLMQQGASEREARCSLNLKTVFSRAKAEMKRREAAFELKHYRYSAKVVHEDGSIYLVENAFVEEWCDLEGRQWVFMFAEHNPPQLWVAEDLVSWATMTRITFRP